MPKPSKNEDGVNVQCVVRCRPAHASEENRPQVVHPNNLKKEVTVSQTVAGGKQVSKGYHFDNVYGPSNTQKEVYSQTVQPIVEEVLGGFNCTVFAYGQTGTGKTWTMEGGIRDGLDPRTNPTVGIIPRALRQIYSKLESMENAEWTVRVSFLEIYNEELSDMLSSEKKNLRLFDDRHNRMGLCVQNLEEVITHNVEDAFSLLAQGNERRQTAETLLNKASSRSHSIFTITIHIKESTPEGEDLLKVGKLNLVDLAGSECIGRSGATKGRAVEAGNINQSLLTLGRVITALVDGLPHVPYRDSKLTRLLQDALGGKTKTCIIATVSPSSVCIEETMSTLDYAQRAKNIKNKPEVNQKMTKRELLKEYTWEIDQLRAQLTATRDKNGIYLPQSQYEGMQTKIQTQMAQLEEKTNVLEQLEKDFEQMKQVFELKKQELEEVTETMIETKKELDKTANELDKTSKELESKIIEVKEKEVIVQEQSQTEEKLAEKTDRVMSTLNETIKDVSGLHDKIDRKNKVESENIQTVRNFQKKLTQEMQVAVDRSHEFQNQQTASFEQFMTQKFESFHSENMGVLDQLREQVVVAAKTMQEDKAGLDNIVTQHAGALRGDMCEVTSRLQKSFESVNAILSTVFSTVSQLSDGITNVVEEQRSQTGKLMEEARSLADTHRSKAEEFKSTQLQHLETMKGFIQTHTETTVGKLNQHQQSLQEVVEKQARSRDEIQTQVMEHMQKVLASCLDQHQKTLVDSTAKVEESMSEDVQATRDFNTTFAKHHETAVQHVESVTTEYTQACTEKISFIERVDGVEKSSVEQVNKLSADAKENNEQSRVKSSETMESHQSDVMEAIDRCDQHTSDFTEQHGTRLTTMVTALGEAQDKSTQLVDNGKEMAAKIETELKAHVDDVETMTSSMVSSQQIHLQSITEESQGVLGGKVRPEQPTGQTPARRAFSNSPTMYRTRPHQEILAEWRASQHAVASALASAAEEPVVEEDSASAQEEEEQQQPAKMVEVEEKPASRIPKFATSA